MRQEAVAATTALIAARAAAARLTCKVIVSGAGGWRYLDVVSQQAGKLESLTYVRRALGFASGAVVAAGDSGNDIAMLGGRHRAIVVGNAQAELVAWAEEECGVAGACSGEGGRGAAAEEEAEVVDTTAVVLSSSLTPPPPPPPPPPPRDAPEAAKAAGARLYRARAGYAAGVIEGLQAFGLA